MRTCTRPGHAYPILPFFMLILRWIILVAAEQLRGPSGVGYHNSVIIMLWEGICL
jgi:hypothetical protein